MSKISGKEHRARFLTKREAAIETINYFVDSCYSMNLYSNKVFYGIYYREITLCLNRCNLAKDISYER